MWFAPVLAVALAAAPAQAPPVEDVVRRHIPYGTLGLDREDADEDLKVCHAVLETDPQGRPAVIAVGYLAYEDLRLRIIEFQVDGASRIVAGDGVLAGWWGCDLTAVDFDADGRSEIFLTATVGMKGDHVQGWVFRWLGTAASPEPDARLTRVAEELSNPELIDVLHDGTMQLHEYQVHHEDDDVWQTFWVSQGVARTPDPLARYGPAWTVCFGTICGTDSTEIRDVDPAARYTLRLVNGDRAGAHRVRVTSVKVDGRDVLPRAWHGRATEFIDLPIGRLPQKTTIVVTATRLTDEASLLAVLVREP
jgi:hypothetical protein